MRTSVLLSLFVVALGVIALAAAEEAAFGAPRSCRVNDRWSCGTGSYCATSNGKCGDDKGFCVDMPQVCTKIYKPVCGCDGRTYGNECEARSQGVSIKADGECPKAEPCPELRSLCERMRAAEDAFYAELYADQGSGAPLQSKQVDWAAVRRMITNDFQWEDYSVFSSAGIYRDIETYWKAINRANSRYPLVNLKLRWSTCDPFSKRLVAQDEETFEDGEDRSKNRNREKSQSIYVTEFVEDARGNLKIKREAYWTSGNLIDLVRPMRDNHGPW